jgi:hypothetical protein
MNRTNNFKNIGEILQQAKQEPRNYKKESSYKYKPEAARFKLVVWFKNNETRYFYSYDNIYFNGQPITDEATGLMKLVRYVEKINGNYKNAIIYATSDLLKNVKSNYCIEVFKFNMYGTQKAHSLINFKPQEKNVIFDFEKIVYLNKLKIE